MSKLKNNFNSIAWIYDSLAILVFGATWRSVQTSFVVSIKSHSKILILGGGTGACLEHLEPHHQVTFLDLSEKMIERAQQRKTLASVEFIAADFLNWETANQFDAVVCPFFLDSFSQTEVELITKRIKKLLIPQGLLIVVDFQKGNWFQNIVMKIMHLFFRVFSQLKSTYLLDLHETVKRDGFTEQYVQHFYGHWVACRGYTLIK